MSNSGKKKRIYIIILLEKYLIFAVFKLTVTSAHPTIVVGDGHQVVDGLAVVGVDDVLSHVEAPSRKLNHRVQFVPPVAIVAEPLQTNHEKGGQRPQVKLLRGLLVLLAVRAVPRKNNKKRLLITY